MRARVHAPDHAAPPARPPGQAPDEHGHRRARLGPFLCWAVVFADIGTFIYYVPGILYGQVGLHAALFVGMIAIVFILLAIKYAEVTVRYPEGGGVVTVGTRAMHPFVGLLGGMFILVDYFLTAALSAVSAIGYLAFVVPALNNNLTIGLGAIGALIFLGFLNWVGIKESATVTATVATLGFVSQVAVLVAVVIAVGPAHLLATVPMVLHGPRLTPVTVLFGYAGAFLAFSGLESISQLSPAMAEPRARVARLAMGAVVVTIGLTSPLLTLMTTTLLDAHTIQVNASSNALLSILSDATTGRWLGVEVAGSGSILLLFACNTAIIGSYHVFLAISRMRFFPEFVEHRNRLRGTPHFAILLAVGIPILVLIPASQSSDTQAILGDLYAFGLLGAFSVTCLGLDIVRWREQHVAPGAGQGRPGHGARVVQNVVRFLRRLPAAENRSPLLTRLNFAFGVLTTVLVIVAWATNLYHKPLATAFGGTVTLVGLAVAAINYAQQSRRGFPVIFPSVVRAALPDAVMVLLPQGGNGHVDDLVQAAAAGADGRPVVFLYRGTVGTPERRPQLFEVVDPYLHDRAAQEAFSRAERVGRRLGLQRRYVYVPAQEEPDGVRQVWKTIRPQDTLAVAGDEAALCGLAPDRVRRPAGGTLPIVHYLKHWETPL
jgi:amino acid transporter